MKKKNDYYFNTEKAKKFVASHGFHNVIKGSTIFIYIGYYYSSKKEVIPCHNFKEVKNALGY